MLRHLVSAIIVALVVMVSVTAAQDNVPITYQGRLTGPDGNPVTDDYYEIEVVLYPDSTGSDSVCYDSFFDVFTSSGYFMLQFDPGLEAVSQASFIEIRVEGETLSPRRRITPAPSSGITHRVSGDILTAPGVLEIHSPEIGGEAAVNLFTSLSEFSEDVPAMTVSNGAGSGASMVMFNPQPEPPGNDPDPFLEMMVTSEGGGMNFYEPGGIFMGVEPTPFHDGGVLRLYNAASAAPGIDPEPFIEMTVADNGGVFSVFNEFGQYMGIDPNPFNDGGNFQMFGTTSSRSENLALELNTSTSGGTITLYDNFEIPSTQITPGGMDLITGDPVGYFGPPVHMETSFSDARVGIGTSSPDAQLHVVGNIKMVDGQQAVGYVMTSDVNGFGSWRAPTALMDPRIDELLEKIERLEARIAELEAERR